MTHSLDLVSHQIKHERRIVMGMVVGLDTGRLAILPPCCNSHCMEVVHGHAIFKPRQTGQLAP